MRYSNLNISLLLDPFYNGKLSPAPFEFQFFAVSPPRSRINRSVCNERRVGRIDGYSHICFSMRLYVYFAREWPGRSQYKPRVSLPHFHGKRPEERYSIFTAMSSDSILPFFSESETFFSNLRESYSKLSFSLSLFSFIRMPVFVYVAGLWKDRCTRNRSICLRTL